MTDTDRREGRIADRRSAPRGGRRAGDRPGRHPRILVAERYDGVREQCVRYLGLFNFWTEQAANAQQAMEASRLERPAVIIAELGLLTSAAGQLARLGEDERNAAIPVIGLADMEEDKASVEGHPHVAGVLVKPFRLAAMLEEVRRVLREVSRTNAART
jgi:DNA-binding response OmpR family regulator